MPLKLLKLFLILLLAVTPACKKARALGPPKAIPVVSDGHLELNLMSFNLRYENPEDQDSRAWRARIVAAVRMIRAEKPDIIGVQEALHGQAADLWASLPDYEFFGVGRDDGKRAGEYTGIFYRRDRFEADVSEGGTFWLSDTPEAPGSKTWGNEIPRVASWLRLVDRSSQRGFYVFDTHWDHRSQPSREQAALLLSERIDARKNLEEPVILLGDFNAVENNPGIAHLTGRQTTLTGKPTIWKNGVIDTFQALHPNEKSRTTLHFWKGSRAGKLKVDHILVSQGAQIISAEILNSDQSMVSDHFPVTARIIFP